MNEIKSKYKIFFIVKYFDYRHFIFSLIEQQNYNQSQSLTNTEITALRVMFILILISQINYISNFLEILLYHLLLFYLLT